MNTHFTAKRPFWACGTKFKPGKTYPINAHTPDGPDHPAGKHCCFGSTEGEAIRAYIAWKDGGCKD